MQSFSSSLQGFFFGGGYVFFIIVFRVCGFSLLIGWAHLQTTTFKLKSIKESNNVRRHCFVCIRGNINSKLWVQISNRGILFNSHIATDGESRMLSTWSQAVIYMYYLTVNQE